LLFGKRLPEVARNMGKGLAEFRKGMTGVENEVRGAMYSSSNSSSYRDSERSRPVPMEEREELTAPKFEPPASAPHEPAAEQKA
jgi:sec-independent protein translocase protein TatA